jgi:trigger factor
MTDTAVAELPNTCQVEDAGPARKRLTITIPATAIKAKLDGSYKTLQQNAVVPGFRRGKAPRELLEKRFGATLQGEAKSELMSTAFRAAVEEHKLRPIGEPELGGDARTPELDASAPLTFTVEIEIVPAFDLPEIAGTPVERPVIEVTEAHVDMELKRASHRFGTPERIRGPFQPHDRLLAKATVRREGDESPLFETDTALLVVPGPEDEGKGPVLGLMIDDLQSRLEGRSLGEQVVIETTGPESHEREDVRNAKLTIELTLVDAERVTPATLGELLARLLQPSEEALRTQLRQALEQRRDLEQRAAMREQLYDRLLKAMEFPLPEGLSSAQYTRMVERQRVELLHRGIEPEAVERQLAAMRAGTMAQAQAKLKLFFILMAFAEKLSISVSESEINGRVAALARQQGHRPEQFRAELVKTGAINELALQIREHKTADRLLESCTITEIQAEEWNKRVIEEQERLRSAQREASKAAESVQVSAEPLPEAVTKAAQVRRRRS